VLLAKIGLVVLLLKALLLVPAFNAGVATYVAQPIANGLIPVQTRPSFDLSDFAASRFPRKTHV
jgi:hypothetical protein